VKAGGDEALAIENRPWGAALLWQAFLAELDQPQAAASANTWHWPALMAVLLLAAMACGLGWFLLGVAAVRWQRIRSRPLLDANLLDLVDVLCAELGCCRPIEVRQADDLATAATIGWRRPVLLLPADWTTWTAEQRRAVLAHEIAHARSHDFLALLFGQLGLVLHFYHPLVHWLMGRLRLEQELAADAAAASVSGGQWQYLTTIAELALRQQDRALLWPARTFLPTRTTFLRRITMLRDSKLRFDRLSPAARLATVGAVLLCGLLVAGLRGPAGQQQALAAEAAKAVPEKPADSATKAAASPAAEAPLAIVEDTGSKANGQVTTYHYHAEGPAGMSDDWVQMNPDDTPLRARIDYPHTEDGAKVVLCWEGKCAVWFKDKKGYVVLPEKDSLDRVVRMRKVCDPQLAFEELQGKKEAGKVKIETKEPAQEGDFRTLTVTFTDAPNQREVYEVNPSTELAQRVTYYNRQGDQWKEVKFLERLADNKRLDPKVFDLDLPKDVVKTDEIKRPPGLVKGDLTNEQIAAKVAREFFEALIAKDYDKAGLIYGGMPAERMEVEFGHMSVSRIVDIGQPTAGLHPDPSALAVAVKVDCGEKTWVQEYSPQVRLTDNESATKAAREFIEAIIRQDDAAARRALGAGLVFEGFSDKNADKLKEYFEHYKVLRIVEVGKPAAYPATNRLEVPIKVELESKDERIREFTPYIRPVFNQPDRWAICGGI
jgi:beta-lactamase regulating signal transducer with metallopeptidase domain